MSLTEDEVLERLREAAMADNITMPRCSWCEEESELIVGGEEPLAACLSHLPQLVEARPACAAKARRLQEERHGAGH